MCEIIISKEDFFKVGEYNDPADDFLYLLFSKRFGEGYQCPKCRSTNTFKRVKNRTCYQCSHCSFQIYPCKGTIFEKSTINLTWWSMFIFEHLYDIDIKISHFLNMIYSDKYPITYKTAFRMKHLIKPYIIDENFILKIIE